VRVEVVLPADADQYRRHKSWWYALACLDATTELHRPSVRRRTARSTALLERHCL